MARAVDVAEYVLEKHGTMSTMKLHKLVYYCQAYYLVNYGEPLLTRKRFRRGRAVQ